MNALNNDKLKYRVNNFFDIRQVLEKMGYKNVDYGDRIRCPNHDDRNPDCEIFESGEMAYCFVCKEGWTAYELLTEFIGMAPNKLDRKVPALDGDYEPAKINDGYNVEPIRREWLHKDISCRQMVEGLLQLVGKDYETVDLKAESGNTGLK